MFDPQRNVNVSSMLGWMFNEWFPHSRGFSKPWQFDLCNNLFSHKDNNRITKPFRFFVILVATVTTCIFSISAFCYQLPSTHVSYQPSASPDNPVAAVPSTLLHLFKTAVTEIIALYCSDLKSYKMQNTQKQEVLPGC